MKCNGKCHYYQVYSSGGEFKVVCALRGHEIKYIKEKTPSIYENCNKYIEGRK